MTKYVPRAAAIAILLSAAVGTTAESWAQHAYYRQTLGRTIGSGTPPGPGTGEPGPGTGEPGGGTESPFSVGLYDSIPPATLGEAFSIPAPVITGGTAPYAATMSSGSLPQGVNLNGDGSVSGTPSALGSQSATVRFTDAKGNAQARDLSVTVASRPIVFHAGATLAIGQEHMSQISFTGGSGSYSSLTVDLPGLGSATVQPGDEAQPIGSTGLSLTHALRITGTPSASLKSIVGATLSGADSVGRPTQSSAPFDLMVGIEAAQYQLTHGGGTGSAITIPPTQVARGGTGTLTYSIASSPADAGITVNANSGTVSVAASVAANNYAVTVTAHDGGSPAVPSKASTPFTVVMATTIPRPDSYGPGLGGGALVPAGNGLNHMYDADSNTLMNYNTASNVVIGYMTWNVPQPINCVILEATRSGPGPLVVHFLNKDGLYRPTYTTTTIQTTPTTIMAYSGRQNPTGTDLIKYVQVESPTLGVAGTLRTLRAGKMSNPDGTGSCVTAS